MNRSIRGGKVSEGTRFLTEETREKDRERARAYKTRLRAAGMLTPLNLATTARFLACEGQHT